jgi:hypothetical protein
MMLQSLNFPEFLWEPILVGTGVWKRRRRLRADSTGKAHGNGNPAHKRSISSTAARRGGTLDAHPLEDSIDDGQGADSV